MKKNFYSTIELLRLNYLKGEKLTFNKWGQKVTGWSSIRIYDWVLIKGNDKTLHEMRQDKMLSLENEIE
ncbi:hypothetical protein G4W71_01600 [Clostridium botulinum]|nr:hypothetical protein [Clostridium botulinum]